MYTTKDKGGHMDVTLTLIFKISCQGEVNYFGDFVTPDVEKVRFDTKIRSVSCLQDVKKGHKK